MPFAATNLFTIVAVSCVVLSGCAQRDAADRQKPDLDPTTNSKKMLTPETLAEVSELVRSGFYDKERLMEVLCEEMYSPGELDRKDVEAALDLAFAKWESEKQTWPDVTDCDRLDSAFAAIEGRGVIPLQNAGNTQSDGHDDFRDTYDSHPNKASVIGYCFYHGQDLERAVRGEGLMIAFGPVDPKDEETKGAEVGNIIREELERAGFKVDWNGKFDRRLNIPDLVWQRR